MTSGSGPQEARRLEAEHERLRALRLREDWLRSVPSHLDVIAVACLVSGAVVGAIWLVGTRATEGRLDAALLVGGLLGSGSAALVLAGRPSPWWPSPGARWIWRGGALSGLGAAQVVGVLLEGWVEATLGTPSDRLLV